MSWLFYTAIIATVLIVSIIAILTIVGLLSRSNRKQTYGCDDQLEFAESSTDFGIMVSELCSSPDTPDFGSHFDVGEHDYHSYDASNDFDFSSDSSSVDTSGD